MKYKERITAINIAIMFILTLLFVNFGILYFYIEQFNLYSSLEKGIQVLDSDITIIEKNITVFSLIYTVGFLFTGMFFVYWLTNAYLGIKTIFPNLSGTNFQILIVWFIPVIGLYKPYEIMDELYTHSKQLLLKYNNAKSSLLNLKILNIWWFLWIVDSFLIVFASKLNPNTVDVEEVLFSAKFHIVENIFSILLCFITAKMLLNFSRVEAEIDSIVATEYNQN
ncbi:DUF4328 domain-containing protein [Leptospira brenneri]|uniref:DUF4328 domain-containing protein n=1 Tax=Leptospira brenneri TaxID=2023182 RepID=A0A2M9XXI5_9LEPT|nr:DUF4328 domain-containing protein [Leptospira brenneri]PJZ43964.1 hypothetical protein CH361_17600 [Leptospira brenneri]TGK95632.1 DUF4328 domain-containing protein [Leptospira brenneri]